MTCVETAECRPGYRPCVGIFLLNPAGLVFVGQRFDTPSDAWQMPQGGIDPQEDPVAAGRREMIEEIGTDRAELLQESRVWRSYDLPADLARRMWGGRYRGQTQKWLAFRFLGDDADVRLDGVHPEFRAWRWVPADSLLGLIVPFKRDVYRRVVAEFRPLWKPAA
jgi:putative (di)nucleoside polyphosphate hydrolase